MCRAWDSIRKDCTEGTRTRIQFECYHIWREQNTQQQPCFRGNALPSSLEERSPASHMNAPPPGVGKTHPQGEMCHSVWPLHFPVSFVKPGKCQDLPLTGWMKNNSHTCSGQDPAHRNYDWGPLSTLSPVLFSIYGSQFPCLHAWAQVSRAQGVSWHTPSRSVSHWFPTHYFSNQ